MNKQEVLRNIFEVATNPKLLVAEAIAVSLALPAPTYADMLKNMRVSQIPSGACAHQMTEGGFVWSYGVVLCNDGLTQSMSSPDNGVVKMSGSGTLGFSVMTNQEHIGDYIGGGSKADIEVEGLGGGTLTVERDFQPVRQVSAKNGKAVVVLPNNTSSRIGIRIDGSSNALASFRNLSADQLSNFDQSSGVDMSAVTTPVSEPSQQVAPEIQVGPSIKADLAENLPPGGDFENIINDLNAWNATKKDGTWGWDALVRKPSIPGLVVHGTGVSHELLLSTSILSPSQNPGVGVDLRIDPKYATWLQEGDLLGIGITTNKAEKAFIYDEGGNLLNKDGKPLQAVCDCFNHPEQENDAIIWLALRADAVTTLQLRMPNLFRPDLPVKVTFGRFDLDGQSRGVQDYQLYVNMNTATLPAYRFHKAA